ncbi:MAG: exodeoxyribonuclease VII large subunit, partial [Sedimenticolaceae bacterium]
MTASAQNSRDVFSVSRLNAEVRAVLEGSFPLVWVEGEISNLATPRSGHLYFSLKDPHAQVRCALFRAKR